MGAGMGKRWWGRLLNHGWLISIIASAEMLKVKAAAAAAAAEVVATSSIHPSRNEDTRSHCGWPAHELGGQKKECG